MGSLVVQPLKTSDIDYIVTNIWDRSEDEAAIFGVPDRNNLREYLCAKLGQRHAYTLKGDYPVAVFGATDQGERIFTTWFVASHDFINYYLPITRALKKIIRQKVMSEQPKQLMTYSACLSGKAQRWFSLLGLHPDPNNNDQPIKRFIWRMN